MNHLNIEMMNNDDQMINSDQMINRGQIINTKYIDNPILVPWNPDAIISINLDTREEKDLEREQEKKTEPVVDSQVNIFRFKFTEEVTTELDNFAKIHRYDDRHSFKDAWTVWIEENNDMIKEEIERLQHCGYEGDSVDKMFKSARYYYRKKSTEKKAPKDRRQYVSVQRELLDSMDDHINNSISEQVVFKPQHGFIDFCNSNKELLQQAVVKIVESGLKDPREIQDKMKRTYKNRYFMIVKSEK